MVTHLQSVASQRKERAEFSVQPRQEVATTHVGEEPDCRLGHGEHSALSGHTEAAVHSETHTPACPPPTPGEARCASTEPRGTD